MLLTFYFSFQDKAEEEEADVHFEPVVRLTEKVEIKTNEEAEEQSFTEAQREWEDPVGHETGQDAESLRKSLWWVAVQSI
jgi:hypothetical protein